MATAELKTKPSQASITKFLDSIADEKKRADAYVLLDMMKKITNSEPKLWGGRIVGFGDYHYISERTGREGDWFVTGFSPGKTNLTVYGMGGGWDRYDEIKNLGKYTLGVGCLYIKKLDDVHLPTLRKLIVLSVKETKKQAAVNAKKAKPRKA